MKYSTFLTARHWLHLPHLLALVLSLVAVQTVSATEYRGLIYEAEKDGQTVFLLGSVHLADDSFYPMPKTIEAAYRSSGALVVEADILASAKDPELQQQIMAASTYPPGETLRDHIPEKTFSALESWLQQRQIPIAVFLRMRPAIASITLSMVEMQRIGLNPNLGIDRYFLQQAHSSGKQILQLESVVQQLQMLNNLEHPERLLEQTLEQLSELENFVPRMTDAWKSGNAEQLYQLVISEGLQEHPEFSGLYDKLFFQRNREMAQKILQLSQSHSSLFVVVGAGHLVGTRSIIDLLQKEGFRIKQL
ncbi:TraB/GumN family protein [Microbulbifer celer]|uniref:TraB/GumN family protein n=1 Tax=Microbulbifer celer TaxID=435905 RepID=A0ABW3U716_9GAMM|nr:TraB/GumN family protein [Microbulbifer celer]UFN58500.1 TraB/GumN family protein [Microbulbifer celer]